MNSPALGPRRALTAAWSCSFPLAAALEPRSTTESELTTTVPAEPTDASSSPSPSTACGKSTLNSINSGAARDASSSWSFSERATISTTEPAAELLMSLVQLLSASVSASVSVALSRAEREATLDEGDEAAVKAWRRLLGTRGWVRRRYDGVEGGRGVERVEDEEGGTIVGDCAANEGGARMVVDPSPPPRDEVPSSAASASAASGGGCATHSSPSSPVSQSGRGVASPAPTSRLSVLCRGRPASLASVPVPCATLVGVSKWAVGVASGLGSERSSRKSSEGGGGVAGESELSESELESGEKRVAGEHKRACAMPSPGRERLDETGRRGSGEQARAGARGLLGQWTSVH